MTKYIIIAAVLAAGMYLLTSCLKDHEENYEENLKKGQEYLATNALREGVVTTQSGLQYEVLREGNKDGKRPTAADQVRCYYTGTFIDGKVFDLCNAPSDPIVFPLSGVIRGWTEGLQYMTEGSKYRFVIPYQLAYGTAGVGPIPPYSTLIFEVELIEVL